MAEAQKESGVEGRGPGCAMLLGSLWAASLFVVFGSTGIALGCLETVGVAVLGSS